MIMILSAALAAAAPATPANPPTAGHAEHGMDHQGCKCCEKMHEQGDKMDCCDEHAKEHAGHDSQPAQ